MLSCFQRRLIGAEMCLCGWWSNHTKNDESEAIISHYSTANL